MSRLSMLLDTMPQNRAWNRRMRYANSGTRLKCRALRLGLAILAALSVHNGNR